MRATPDSRYLSSGAALGALLKVSVACTVCAGLFLIGAAGFRAIPVSAGPLVSIFRVAPASMSAPRLPTKSRAEYNALAVPDAVLASIKKVPAYWVSLVLLSSTGIGVPPCGTMAR